MNPENIAVEQISGAGVRSGPHSALVSALIASLATFAGNLIATVSINANRTAQRVPWQWTIWRSRLKGVTKMSWPDNEGKMSGSFIEIPFNLRWLGEGSSSDARTHWF